MKTLLKLLIVFGFLNAYCQNGATILSAKINGNDIMVTQGEDFNQIYGVLAKTPMFFQLSRRIHNIQNPCKCEGFVVN